MPLSLQTASHFITLPQRTEFEGANDHADMCIRFLRYLDYTQTNDHHMKILSAIHYVADTMNYSDAQVSKVLVGQGLRAPRKAFPSVFLEYIDLVFMSDAITLTSSHDALCELTQMWNDHGEYNLNARRSSYDMNSESTA